jgi:hypothetical protein
VAATISTLSIDFHSTITARPRCQPSHWPFDTGAITSRSGSGLRSEYCAETRLSGLGGVHKGRTPPSASKLACLRRLGWCKKCPDAGTALDAVTPTSSSILCGAKTVMSAVVDSVPARLRHTLSTSETFLTPRRRIESQPRAKPRNAPTPRALQLEDRCRTYRAPRPLGGSPFRSVALRSSARGRGESAESVAPNLDFVHTRRGSPATELG